MVRKPNKYKSGYQTNRLLRVSIERKNYNLIIIKPPRCIPFFSKPVVSRLNYIYLSLILKRSLKKLGFNEYVLWNYRPEYNPGIRIFDYKKIVFDIVDDLASYKKKGSREFNYIRKCIDRIIQKSDLVIVTASTLFEKYRKMAKNISLIPNGYDSNLFSCEVTKKPDDMHDIKPPIIGFIGTLFSFLDYELLAYVINKNPDKSFVFIGHCEENSRNVWMDIIKHDNVYWLGKKRKEEVPRYLFSFDVCINPFQVSDVSRSVSPLKVFEFLAMKKPVVSVRMESLEKEEVAPYISFSSSYEEFSEKLNKALQNKNNFKNTFNYEIIKKYSWDYLFERAKESVEKL
jgi:hypothetical protein